MRVDLHEARTGQHKDRGSLRQRIARAARVSTRSVRAHCMLVGGRVVHKRGCTPRHPRCAWSRRAYGEIVCDCPAYDFLHRQGSGRCGDQMFGRGRWAQNDPDRAYTTITSRGKKDRFSTLKRAVEHARILAAHDRVHVDVLLGSRVVSRVRPGVARDLVSAEKRAENRTIDIDPSKIPTFGWKGYKLADLSFSDLDLLRLQIIADPKNHTPRDAKGHPVRGVWLYTPTARKKLEALAWAVTYKLQGQGGATRRDPTRRRATLESELSYAREAVRFWARQDHRLSRDEYAQKVQAERRVREVEAALAKSQQRKSGAGRDRARKRGR